MAEPILIDPDRVLTPNQLARREGVDQTTPLYWRRAGTGPTYFMLGSKYYYRFEDVLAWERKTGRQPAEQPA